MDFESVAAAFRDHYGQWPDVVAAAPGRVNLIGEHIDYNGGFVLPFAVAQRIYAAAAANETGQISVYSYSLQSNSSFSIDVTEPTDKLSWENYARGMVAGLRQYGVNVTGAHIYINGDLPVGSGMSSSAALCVSIGLALSTITNVEVPLTDMALIAQKTEHNFAGTPCGIMDQYASCFGREDHALLLDCSGPTHEYVPFSPRRIAVLAIPSGVKHDLAVGAYEQRVISCRKAIETISTIAREVRSFREVSMEVLEAAKSRMDEVTYRRARHVVTEMRRVNLAVGSLRNGEFDQLGTLINETQDSLRDDYEVSCLEIDELIRVLRSNASVLGARMVGGGFGGVVLAIVEDSNADEVIRMLESDYYGPNNIDERPFRIEPSAGASAIRLM